MGSWRRLGGGEAFGPAELAQCFGGVGRRVTVEVSALTALVGQGGADPFSGGYQRVQPGPDGSQLGVTAGKPEQPAGQTGQEMNGVAAL